MILKVKKYNVALTPGKRIFACHVKHDSDDFRQICGGVVTSQNKPSLLGLKNTSNIMWESILPDGTRKECPNGQVVRLMKGLKINFGNGNIAEVY